jgi:2-iminobutanoate/2-iminopropanoate deaminase
MPTKTVIQGDSLPKAIGPYSLATQFGNLVFTSGQLGRNPETGEFPAAAAEQAEWSLRSIQRILEAAGFSLADVLKTTLYLTDMGDFAAVNEVFAQFFPPPFPARETVEVRSLPAGGRVEVSVIAGHQTTE